MNSLREEVEEARKISTDLEKKYNQVAEELDSTKAHVDDLKRQNQMLEKRLQETHIGRIYFDIEFLSSIFFSHTTFCLKM